MKAQILSSLTVFCLSGMAYGQEPIKLDPSGFDTEQTGYIYFNVATGEKLATLDRNGPDIELGQDVDDCRYFGVWISDITNMCASVGAPDPGARYWALDRPEIQYSTGYVSPARWNNLMIDWGDIYPNTVVDLIQVYWASAHIDTDEDSDGLPDGIEGFSANWVFYDGMNGRAPQMYSVAQPIISIRLHTLPGILQDKKDPVTTAAAWVVDLDLGGGGSSSMVFEIGDTDSNMQYAAVHNPRMDLRDEDSDSVSDLDIDQDGLADWGWSIQFAQPGTIDVDNADGDSDSQTGIDGDPSAWAPAGVRFGAPSNGYAEVNPDYPNSGAPYNWISYDYPGGVVEDLFTLGQTEFPDGSGNFVSMGENWFGGLDCSGGYMQPPLASFAINLYQRSLGCPADLNCDGLINFMDVTVFVSLFLNNDVIFADFNGDGILNFLDASAFVAAFQAGCP